MASHYQPGRQKIAYLSLDQLWLLLLNWIVLAALAASTHQLHDIAGFARLFLLQQL